MSRLTSCVDCGRLYMSRAAWAVRCIDCWRAMKARGQRDLQPVADPRLPALDEWRDMLPRLLRLAHPDKHGNSEMATTATRWLLKQRKRLEVRP